MAAGQSLWVRAWTLA